MCQEISRKGNDAEDYANANEYKERYEMVLGLYNVLIYVGKPGRLFNILYIKKTEKYLRDLRFTTQPFCDLIYDCVNTLCQACHSNIF